MELVTRNEFFFNFQLVTRKQNNKSLTLELLIEV